MAVAPAAAAADYSITVRESAGPDWDPFVTASSRSSLYHLSGWTYLAKEVFGHRTLFVEARDRSGSLLGVLPVVQQRSLLFGKFAISVAFFNYGGPVAKDPETAHQMMIRAAVTVERLGCRYLEFRDTSPQLGKWAMRSDKITLQLPLPTTFQALSRALGAKLRSQVKRAEREDLHRRTGRLEVLDDFYAVFSENMRDLGTPVYPKRFFEAILSRFGAQCQLVIIDWRGKPAAAAFLVFWRGHAEVPWAACRARAKPLGLNMKLYWELLSLSVERGCTLFDFGRSTVDSGTYRFKRQWGAQPVPLYWYRWEGGWKDGHSSAQDPGRALQLATAMWRRLPLRLANIVGPHLSGGLPW